MLSLFSFLTHAQVIQLPLEDCSTNTDCMSCTDDDVNPLCGWCTVENKCSRSSQCQNASETRRWIQDSTECISVELSTAQFIIDNPQSVGFATYVCIHLPPSLSPTVALSWRHCIIRQITLQVNVMVTPGLPPPLNVSGETYQCYFNSSNGVFMTEAVDSGDNNTLYTCNLTSFPSDFDGVQLGMCTYQ